jgi:polar amino acid transport system substrate-binding protein
MKFFLLSILFLFPILASAVPLKLVTGEYVPYTGEQIIGQGISTEIVRAVFKEINMEVVVEFMPWNRVMKTLLNTKAAGSFPWTMNQERQTTMLYSEAINEFKIISFTKKGSKIAYLDKSKKTLCLPSGWDPKAFIDLSKKFNMQLVRPINIESCVQMLVKGRVDFFLVNEKVGWNAIEKIYGKNSPIEGNSVDFFIKKNMLYFIVPKKYPDAENLILEFNKGLAKIKKNGIYDKIISKAKSLEDSKSTCEFCSLIGLK